MVRRLCAALILMMSALSFSVQAAVWETRLKVTAEQANIRRNPDIGSPIIHQAPMGSILVSSEKEGEWYHINYTLDTGETLTGYVHESLVKSMEPELVTATNPPAPKPAPPEIKPVEIKPAEIKPIEVTPIEAKPPPAEPPPSQPRTMTVFKESNESPLALLFYSGGGRLSGGDINRGVSGLSDFISDQRQGRPDNEPGALHFHWIFGGGFEYALTPAFSLEGEVEYLAGKNSSRIVYGEFDSGDRLFLRPEISAVPVRMSASFLLFPNFRLKAGLEWIFAHCEYTYRVEQGEDWQQWQGEADGSGWGIAGGFRYERDISAHFSAFIETSARYSRVESLEGHNILTDSDGLSAKEDGPLWLYQTGMTPDASRSLLFIRERRPTEAGVTNAGKAELNFSGVSLRLGIRFRF